MVPIVPMPRFEQFETALSCNDISLVPRQSSLKSRSEVDLSLGFKGLRLKYPVFASPMDQITGDQMATLMAIWGGIGVIHRY